jgi:Cu/Ag efflux pump CusA
MITSIPSNIMSLCGIAISIGILVDGCCDGRALFAQLAPLRQQKVHGDTSEIVIRSCRLVGRRFFSVLIMLLLHSGFVTADRREN